METSKKEEGKNTELSKIVFLGRKREKLEEKRKKEEIKEIDKEEEEVEDIYQDTMEETEEEASRDKEEEEIEDIYQDTMERRESTKEEEGEPKTGESSLEDAIIQDENEGERESPRDEGLCRVPVRRGRDKYGSKHGLTLHAAARGYYVPVHRQDGGVMSQIKTKDRKLMISRVAQR